MVTEDSSPREFHGNGWSNRRIHRAGRVGWVRAENVITCPGNTEDKTLLPCSDLKQMYQCTITMADCKCAVQQFYVSNGSTV
jgi:hypothetical protein